MEEIPILELLSTEIKISVIDLLKEKIENATRELENKC